MPESKDRLSTLNAAEIVRLETESRAWNKELRRGMAALVSRRMAKEISYEEYLAGRKTAKDEAAECEHRMSLLRMEITSRHDEQGTPARVTGD